jgi:hypothetical protein
MKRRVIHLVIEDVEVSGINSQNYAIAEGEQFISGMSEDEFLGRLMMHLNGRKCGMRTEVESLKAREGKSENFWDYHPLKEKETSNE